MKTKQLGKLVVNTLEELKAFDIQVMNVKKMTSITDMMIIASGNSSRQVKALANKTIETVKAKKVLPLGTEGVQEGDWALIDLGDVIVHIMRPPVREYYQLEKLWMIDSRQMSASP